MNELGNPKRGDYRKTYPKHFKCSHCGEQRLLMLLQDEHKLSQSLCRKCLNDAPAALIDLIKRMNAYITKLEGNRDSYCAIAAAYVIGTGINSSDLSLANIEKRKLTRP